MGNPSFCMLLTPLAIDWALEMEPGRSRNPTLEMEAPGFRSGPEDLDLDLDDMMLDLEDMILDLEI